ncbi:MAG: nucleotidyltransferase domain-containing protein [Acidobacteria bacterium]|nr:MAG: nucleotidyltransferase domain-containing protein [Acidobacteriota bacterium]
MDRERIVARLRDALVGRPEVAAAYLYGSVARGRGRPGSDVDLGVLWRGDPPATLEGLGLAIEADLEAAVGRPLQVVVLQRAPVDLVHRILRDGVLVVERDPSARVRFEVKARRDYFDLLPHLRRYRRLEATP